MPLTVILIIISFPSPTLSFIPDLKHPFTLSCKSFPLKPFFFFFRTDYMIPQTCTVTSEHIRFYLLVFSVFTLFSCRFRAVQIKLTHVGFRAHVKLASRIVSYPMAQTCTGLCGSDDGTKTPSSRFSCFF